MQTTPSGIHLSQNAHIRPISRTQDLFPDIIRASITITLLTNRDLDF